MGKTRKNKNGVKYVLCFDPATIFGYAVFSFECEKKYNLEEFGHFSNKLKRFEGGGMVFIKLERFLNDLYEKYYKQGFVYATYELSRFRQISIDASHLHGALYNKIMEFFEKKHVPYTSFSISEIKKMVIGRPQLVDVCPSCAYSYIDEVKRCVGCGITRTKHKIDKNYVRRYVERRFGINVDKDDESDAIACGMAFIKSGRW